MGMTDREVEKLFMIEAFYMGTVGSFIGVIAGGFASYSLSKYGMNFSVLFKKLSLCLILICTENLVFPFL